MRIHFAASIGALCAVVAGHPLTAQAPPGTGRGDTVLVLTDSSLIAEDLAWDARTSAWYVSSVRQRRILRIGRDGVTRDFVPSGGSGLWSPYAIALDRARNWLWVTSGATAEGAGTPAAEVGRTAVLAFDLSSGALAGRYELRVEPGATRTLADLALMEDGTLVVSDSRGGGCYALDPALQQFTPLVPQGTFRSPQGPAEIRGTHAVLIADYARGLARVDRLTGAVSWLGAPADLALKGIDGIQLRGTILIVVQNGVRPNRVVRMQLDSAITRIVAWQVLAQGAPTLVEPTHGVWVGGDFLYIANSGWDHVGDDGGLQDEETLRRTVIRRIRVGDGH